VEVKRHLLVTPDIARLLDGADLGTGFPDAMADIVNARYLAGNLVRVGLTYKERAFPDLERLDGLIDDVWAMCYRRPRPGWRLLGRFVEPDTFIALRAYDRHQIGSVEKYSLAAHNTIADWEGMFGTVEPLRGREVGDYLQGVWIDVNQTD
jgi:hypothetical protein